MSTKQRRIALWLITTSLSMSQLVVTGIKYNALLKGIAEDKYKYPGNKAQSAPKRGVLMALKPMGMPTYRW